MSLVVTIYLHRVQLTITHAFFHDLIPFYVPVLCHLVEKKEQAYRDLIAGLVGLVQEQSKIKDLKIGVVGLSDQDIDSVLESIPDTSGKYIDTVDRLQVEVLKEEEEIMRKRFTESKKASEQQRALDEYYDAAKDLCQSQALYMA